MRSPVHKTSVVGLAAVLFAANAFAQGVSGPGTGGGSLLGSSSGWPVQGRVVMEDGSAPPERVTIETVCGTVSRRGGQTDAKGAFGFRLGQQNASTLVDAASAGRTAGTTAGQTDASPLGDCAVRAVLIGYRSDNIRLSNRRASDGADIGTIVLHKIASGIASATSERAPKAARNAFQKAEEAINGGKRDEALANLQKAVQAYPQFAEAWLELGKLQVSRNEISAARQSFSRAIDADPAFAAPYMQIIGLDAKAGDFKALAAVTERLLQVNAAAGPGTYLYNAVANLNLGNLPAAEASARQGQRLDSRHEYPKLWQVAGAVLARRGDYKAAAEQYRLCIEYGPNAPDIAAIRAQLAEVERLAAEAK